MCRALFASVIFVTVVAAPAWAGVHDFVVYLPGMGGTSELAKTSIEKFCRYLEGELKWAASSCTGQYFDDGKQAQEYIEKQKPGFGLISAGTYLDLACGKTPGAEPIAAVGIVGMSRAAKYHVVVKKGGPKSLDQLKGKKLSSNHLINPKMVSRVIFAGKVDVQTHFVTKSTPSPVRPLRDVSEGKADAALIDDGQLAGAKKDERLAGVLEVIYSSEPMPSYPVVSFPSVTKAPERDAVRKTVIGMCASTAGGEVCKSLQIERFEPLDAAAFKTAVQQYCKP